MLIKTNIDYMRVWKD